MLEFIIGKDVGDKNNIEIGFSSTRKLKGPKSEAERCLDYHVLKEAVAQVFYNRFREIYRAAGKKEDVTLQMDTTSKIETYHSNSNVLVHMDDGILTALNIELFEDIDRHSSLKYTLLVGGIVAFHDELEKLKAYARTEQGVQIDIANILSEGYSIRAKD